MASKKSQNGDALLPRLRELPRWAYYAIAVVSLVAALVLNYLNATRFPIIGTSAAVIVYLVITWSLAAAFERIPEGATTRILHSEIGAGIVLVLIGASAGGFAGVVWWLAAGPEMASLYQAITGGAVMGAMVILFMLGGP